MGGAQVRRFVFGKGWRRAPREQEFEQTEFCVWPHVIIVASGKMVYAFKDGELEVGPGDVAYLPANHDAWTVGDEPCVCIEFTPPKEFKPALMLRYMMERSKFKKKKMAGK